MRRSQYSDKQVAEIIQEHMNGKTVREICREYSVCDTTFYKWRAAAGFGKRSTDEKAITALRKENALLKSMLEEQAYKISQLKHQKRIHLG